MNIQTKRLRIREATYEDAPFFLKLLNQPSYIKNIRDSGVKNLSEARVFIEKFYLKNYYELGFGLYLIEDQKTLSPQGICGFVKRNGLSCPDFGFAVLEEFQGLGLIQESGRALLDYSRTNLGLKDIAAITTKANQHSRQTLFALGFRFEKEIILPPDARSFDLFTYP